MSTAQLQCQVEAARFSSTSLDVDTVRARAVKDAVRELRAGHGRDAALQVMLAGLKAQCPLTFHAPTTTGGAVS